MDFEEVWRHDCLFQLIEKHELQKQLLDQTVICYNQIKSTTFFENQYCTVKSEEHYLATPPTMRNWLKQLNSYIRSERIGRSDYLNRDAFIKLKIALLLRKFERYTLARVERIVAVRVLPNQDVIPHSPLEIVSNLVYNKEMTFSDYVDGLAQLNKELYFLMKSKYKN